MEIRSQPIKAVLISQNARMIIVKSNKDNQLETITTEAIAWALVIGILYLLVITAF